IDGNKILITYTQKLFNGKTKFGLDNNFIECDSIILDDSHAGMDAIRNAFTINLDKDHPIYEKLRQLFENDLKEQGQGTYLEILDNKYESQLPVPYWSFYENKDEVLQLLSEYKEDKEILFTWPLIKDSLKNMQLHISGHELEFTPYHL